MRYVAQIFIFIAIGCCASSAAAQDLAPNLGRFNEYQRNSVVVQASPEARDDLGIETYDLYIKDQYQVSITGFDGKNQFVAKIDLKFRPGLISIKTRINTGVWITKISVEKKSGITEHKLKKEWRAGNGRVVDSFSVITRFLSDRKISWSERLIDQVFRYNDKSIIRSMPNIARTAPPSGALEQMLEQQKTEFGGSRAEAVTRAIIGDKNVRSYLGSNLSTLVSFFDVKEFYSSGKPVIEKQQIMRMASLEKDLIQAAGCVGACGIGAVCFYTGCGAVLGCVGCAGAGTSCAACVASYINSSSGGGGSSSDGGISPTEEIRDESWTCYRTDSNTIVCEIS